MEATQLGSTLFLVVRCTARSRLAGKRAWGGSKDEPNPVKCIIDNIRKLLACVCMPLK